MTTKKCHFQSVGIVEAGTGTLCNVLSSVYLCMSCSLNTLPIAHMPLLSKSLVIVGVKKGCHTAIVEKAFYFISVLGFQYDTFLQNSLLSQWPIETGNVWCIEGIGMHLPSYHFADCDIML